MSARSGDRSPVQCVNQSQVGKGVEGEKGGIVEMGVGRETRNPSCWPMR